MEKILKLAPDIFDQLEDNNKRVTIRKGRRDIPLGELRLECTDTNRSVNVMVINVHYCRLGNVYMGDLNDDGFKDHSDMFETMKRFYPDITFDDEVTTIKFVL